MRKFLPRLCLIFFMLVESLAFTNLKAGAQSTSATISFQNGLLPTTSYTGETDTYISENSPATNYGATGDLRVDGDDPVGSGQDLSTLMRWDISAIPAGSIIQAVSITVQVDNPTAQVYSVYQLRRAWVEREATWSLAGTGTSWEIAGAVGSTDRDPTALGDVTVPTNGAYTFSLNSAGIAAVQNWIDNPSSNYGLMIAGTSPADGLSFNSNNNSPASRHPMLNITYQSSSTITPTPAIPTSISTNTATSTSSPTPTIPIASGPALVSLTFDDGNPSVYNTAFPILSAQGLPASFFFITSWLTDSWKAQLKDLENHGWEIGSHTVNHTKLDTVTLDQVDYELGQSKLDLESAGLRVTGFAYPYGGGGHDSTILQHVVQYYSYARSVYPGYNRAPLQTYALYAQVQDSSVSLDTMKSWVDTAIATNQWVIICMHQIDNTGGTYSIPPDTLSALASYIKSKVDAGGIRAVTLRDGFSLYGGTIPTSAPTSTGASTYTPTNTATSTLTSNATFTSTATYTATATAIFTKTPTPAVSNTATFTATSTVPSTPSETPTLTKTPSPTSTYTPTNTSSLIPSATATSTPTNTATLIPSDTPTSTLTAEPNPTATPIVVSTDTPTSTSTSTSTATFTSTPPANRAPDQPILVQPIHGATNISTAVPLEVRVTDPDADQLNITFYGRAVGAGSGTDFDLIVLPDTQNYSTLFPEIYTFQTQWISDHKSSSNIAFVAQVGDLVNLASSVPEYINADAAMDILDAGNIPYSVVPGNHDYPLDNYNTYFGVSRFSGKAYYGGHYGVGNENNYSLFTASRMDFILINLEYQPTTQELDWADSLLKTYSNRRGIVVSHDILNLDNSWSYPALYHELKDNANLFLILCGHMHLPDDGAAIRTEIGDHGNKVYVLLSDYQDYPNGGDGYLRLLRFSPANDKIYVQTYSPYESAFMTDEQNQFELPYTMPDLGGFSVLGTINGVSSGETASLIWSGLANGQQYEWYTVASDGAFQTTSADWSFTTIDISTATTEPSPTVTSTLTSTLTFTPTTTATFTATATATYTLTNTATTTPTKTFTFTPTSTLTSTATRTLAATASNTPTLTMTPSPTDTLTSTATSTYTVAPSATITNTPAATSTSTPTPTLTRAPTSTATSTQTPTPTLTSTSTVTSTPSGTILFSPTANVAVNTNAGDNNGYEVSPGNAYLDDNLYARDVNSGTTTSTSCTTQGKDKHDFYNYGLNLPSSIVTGIVVRLNALTSSVTGSPKICVQLSWNGGLSWTSAKNTTTLTTGEQPYVLGGGTDTWGHAWTTSQLSDANFRVRVIDVASSISITFSLDRVAVQIYYR